MTFEAAKTIDEWRNTNAMSLDPEHPDEFVMLGAQASRTVAVLVTMSGEAFSSQVPYQVIVESWGKIKAGRGKRQWLQTFSDAERNKIKSYYGKFYRWTLVSGVPRRLAFRWSTLQLLKKAVEFFATL